MVKMSSRFTGRQSVSRSCKARRLIELAEEDGKTKVRLLRVFEIMRRTDEKHPLNATQICEKLEMEYGIKSERKAIGRDLKCINAAGYEIVKCANHNDGAYMVDQLYEDYELKILADAVGSAHFLTESDTVQLLAKIRNMATDEGKSVIEDTVFFDKHLKSDDKHNKIKIDALIRAIREKKKIKFKYFEIVENIRMIHRRHDHVYCVSPYFLALYDNEYYLICNSMSSNKALHFRIEMIDELEILDEPARPIKEIESFYDEDKRMRMTPAEYLRKAVDMWSGKTENVVLECVYDAYKDIRNTFGRDVRAYSFTKDTFRVKVPVIDNQGFYHWLAGKGTNIKIILPVKVKNAFQEYISKIAAMYQ